VHIDDLVVGDVVRIETGKTIPADAILIDGKDIEMDEAAITGESKKVRKLPYSECIDKLKYVTQKSPDDVNPSTVPSPILFSGTKVRWSFIQFE